MQHNPVGSMTFFIIKTNGLGNYEVSKANQEFVIAYKRQSRVHDCYCLILFFRYNEDRYNRSYLVHRQASQAHFLCLFIHTFVACTE